MLFAISKIVGFLTHPVSLSLAMMMMSLLAMIIGRLRSARILASTALLLGLATLVSPMGMMLIHPLEQRFVRTPLPETVHGIICLGGGVEGTISLARGVTEFANGGDRLYQTVLLAKRYPQAVIIYTGRESASDGRQDAAHAYFTSLGIDEKRLVFERASRNTDENVRFSKPLADNIGTGNWVLVTSAFHMPRSVALFRKHQWPVIAWPSDFRTTGTMESFAFATDFTGNIETSALAIKEWIGLVAYWLLGRIDDVFPAPQ